MYFEKIVLLKWFALPPPFFLSHTASLTCSQPPGQPACARCPHRPSARRRRPPNDRGRGCVAQRRARAVARRKKRRPPGAWIEGGEEAACLGALAGRGSCGTFKASLRVACCRQSPVQSPALFVKYTERHTHAPKPCFLVCRSVCASLYLLFFCLLSRGHHAYGAPLVGVRCRRTP